MKRSSRFIFIVAVLLWLIVAVPLVYAVFSPLYVSYIDVGQGDSILFRVPDGTDILIDGGPVAAGPTVVAYLQQQGVDDIEIMMLSHADSDHVGGLIAVLQSSIPVEAVIYNGQHGTTTTYNALLLQMQARGLTPTPVHVGDAFNWGAMDVAVFNPQLPLDDDTNENSVVARLSYGNNRFLFTGDIGISTEQDILALGTPITADVLKVSHHGSKYASSAAFLAAVSPTYAIISVGDNSYGHPTQDTLDRLAAVGAIVYRTDLMGTVVMVGDGNMVGPVHDLSYSVYLPLVQRDAGTFDPGNVQITHIFFDGLEPYTEGDEYAVIENLGGAPVNLGGWRLNAGAPGQDFFFPDFVMQPQQECRVYTDEYHPESCGFSFGSSVALWTNSGDCGYLHDARGELISTHCY